MKSKNKYSSVFKFVRRGLFALMFVGLLSPGCGKRAVDGRPTPVPTSGVVLYNNEPCADAKIVFAPQDHQYSAIAQTDSNGKFRLQTFDPGDGAVAGNFKVVVAKFEAVDLPDGGFRETSFIPEKYADPQTSGLTAVVPEKGTSDITLNLTD